MSELEPTRTELEPTATERLRALLDERGVEWETDRSGNRVMWGRPVDPFHDTMEFKAVDNALPNGGLNVHICGFTPEQAIAATLGDADATGGRQRVAGKVYIVEACDELLEGWCPLVAYLSREAAGRHAESLRGEVDGVMSFARVVEMEVLG